MALNSTPTALAVPSVSAQDTAKIIAKLRSTAPLIHVITNDVVVNFTANVLLAIGASPAMLSDPQESIEMQSVNNALSINVGTLTRSQQETILAAVNAANAQGKPWVLDPVAVGLLSLRSTLCQTLLTLKPAVIRGNASEILALAGESTRGRGTDSTDASEDALIAAQTLAQRCGAVVAVTGAVDYITDGRRSLSVRAGDPMLTRVTGTGCSLSSMLAAFIAVEEDTLLAVAAGCAAMAVSGQAAAATCQGPGSFAATLLDQLYSLNQTVLDNYL